MDYQFTVDELQEMLAEQIEFVKASCAAFDSGVEAEVKRLAACVRLLVHDTSSSKSLLGQLGMKCNNFVDSSIPFDPRNQSSHSGLIQTHFTKQGIVPKAHLDQSTQTRRVTFEDWWHGVVFVDQARNEFSRRDIVLTLANKEGGAHVDPSIDSTYRELRKGNSLGWFTVSREGQHTPGADEVPACMRQIAHELLRSLIPGFAARHPESEDTLMVSCGAMIFEASGVPSLPTRNPQKRRPIVSGTKVGMNDKCPCGSGKKYKRCCLNL